MRLSLRYLCTRFYILQRSIISIIILCSHMVRGLLRNGLVSITRSLSVSVGSLTTAESGPVCLPPPLRTKQSLKLSLQLVLHQDWEDAEQSKDDK